MSDHRAVRYTAVDVDYGLRDGWAVVAAAGEGLFDLYPVGSACGEPVDDVARIVAAQSIVRRGDVDREAGRLPDIR